MRPGNKAIHGIDYKLFFFSLFILLFGSDRATPGAAALTLLAPFR